MSEFDGAVSVDQGARKERVALSSIAASAMITLAKFAAGLLSGSLALISEAGHALVDTAATTITYFAIKTANKPADEEHHYGHGKFESLAALTETIALFVLATLVVTQAIERLRTGGGEFEPTAFAFGVLILSIIVDLNRVRILRKVAKDTGSQALAADAIHFASDMVGSVLVLVGLLAAVAGFKYGDALAALGVAGFIAVAGWRLGRQTVDTLLDKAPEGLGGEIRDIVRAVPGVVDIERLRLRPSGTNLLGDATIVVSRTLPLDRVTQVKNRVIAEVEAAHPGVALTINTVPKALDDETVLEKVLVTAARCRVPVHHVTVQTVGERLSVSLDMEVDGRLTLAAAHTKATKLEAAIREELGPQTEVETHIEPLEVKHLTGQDASREKCEAVERALERWATGITGIEAIHDIRVRQTDAGLIVNYHCRVDPAQTVADVHAAVDLLERSLRVSMPEIARIIGHAEPIGKAEPH